MKYGFIGAGNIASAIIKGMIKNKVAKSSDILIFDVNETAKNNCIQKNNVIGADTTEYLIETSDIIVFAIKPYILPMILTQYKDIIQKETPLLISVVASQTIEKIESYLGFKPHLIRVMPNVNAEISESMTAICKNTISNNEDLSAVQDIFNAIGKTIEIDESLFPEFSAIAGSSPAFTYLFIESIANAALKAGFNKTVALKIVAQAVLGSAKMILETDIHPQALADSVCSPGGTTIEGMCSLDKSGFPSAVVTAIDAVIAKDRAAIKKQ